MFSGLPPTNRQSRAAGRAPPIFGACFETRPPALPARPLQPAFPRTLRGKGHALCLSRETYALQPLRRAATLRLLQHSRIRPGAKLHGTAFGPACWPPRTARRGKPPPGVAPNHFSTWWRSRLASGGGSPPLRLEHGTCVGIGGCGRGSAARGAAGRPVARMLSSLFCLGKQSA